MPLDGSKSPWGLLFVAAASVSLVIIPWSVTAARLLSVHGAWSGPSSYFLAALGMSGGALCVGVFSGGPRSGFRLAALLACFFVFLSSVASLAVSFLFGVALSS